MKKWIVCAPFFEKNKKNTWIDDFIESKNHEFEKIYPPLFFESISWHSKKIPITSPAEWVRHFLQGRSAPNSSADGVITVFPQLPVALGLEMKLKRKNLPVVAYCFNIGRLYEGFRHRASRFALRDVDKFVVHSSKEVQTVSKWLE